MRNQELGIRNNGLGIRNYGISSHIVRAPPGSEASGWRAQTIIFTFLFIWSLGFETGFGGSRVCVVCVVCGGSDLRSFSRSATAGGAKTTPEQVCVPLWHNTHPQVPGAHFQGRAATYESVLSPRGEKTFPEVPLILMGSARVSGTNCRLHSHSCSNEAFPFQFPPTKRLGTLFQLIIPRFPDFLGLV